MTIKTAAKIFSLIVLGGLITLIVKEDIFEENHNYYPSNKYYNSYSQQSTESEKGEVKIDSIYNSRLDSLENDYLIKRSRIQREYREKNLEHKVKSSKN